MTQSQGAVASVSSNMMVGLRIQNFRCFRNVEVDLRPLTVLIGPNDSGKSTFLRSIVQFCQSQIPSVSDASFEPQSQHAPRIVAQYMVNGAPVEGQVGLNGFQGSGLPTNWQKHLLIKLPAEGIRLIDPASDEPRPGAPAVELKGDGSSTASFIDWCLRQDRDRFDAIVTALREKFPDIKDLLIATPGGNYRRVDFRMLNGRILAYDDLSVGVRLLLYYLVIYHHPNPPPLLLIEEPENGLHPKALEFVVSILRDLTTGIDNRPPVQVILSTHSPHLLDQIDIQKEQVLAFFRDNDGARSVKPLSQEKLSKYVEHFWLGELWFNKGEADLVD